MAEKEILSIAEQEKISNAILQIVKSFPHFKSPMTAKKVFWQFMSDGECIGIFTMQGAVYLSKDVTGGFNAQFPFCLRYQCKPTDNDGNMSKQDVLDTIGAWIENIVYPELTGGRTIESIERTATTFLYSKDSDGNTTYQCNFNLKYYV